MQQAANAYSKIAQATHSPRELEAAILMKAATRLQAIRDDWEGRRRELADALTYNRKLWTVLVSSATETGIRFRPGSSRTSPISASSSSTIRLQ